MRKRKAELLRLVGASFGSKVCSLKRIRNTVLKINSEKYREKKFAIFHFICLSLWAFKLSNIHESVRKFVICSLKVRMLQFCIWDFSQYYNNLHFYCTIINWNFVCNIGLSNTVYCDLRNKSTCLNTVWCWYISEISNKYSEWWVDANHNYNFWYLYSSILILILYAQYSYSKTTHT